jgi:hypothetical protein
MSHVYRRGTCFTVKKRQILKIQFFNFTEWTTYISAVPNANGSLTDSLTGNVVAVVNGIHSAQEHAVLIVAKCGKIRSALVMREVATFGALTWIGMKGWKRSFRN